jgi:hypothetical protein
VTAADAYERLRALRGKMKIDYDWKKLRED